MERLKHILIEFTCNDVTWCTKVEDNTTTGGCWGDHFGERCYCPPLETRLIVNCPGCKNDHSFLVEV